MGIDPSDLGLEGKDGSGSKTEIPWVRVYSKERSPSATTGWYVVYLFSAAGDDVYLSLNQGTTRWTGAAFAPRDVSELKARVEWARPLLAARVATRDALVSEIALKAQKSPLGGGYEAGNVVAIRYPRNAIPDEASLANDLSFMTDLLKTLYIGEREATYIPGNPAPEILEATEVAARTAGRRSASRRKGQGFRLTSDERRAIERHSVKLATEHFEVQGWTVRDVGAKESYDLLASRGDERLHIEVKGTTSLGHQIVLTRSEVEQQRHLVPHNALVIVHSIGLDRSTRPPTATGGVLTCISPWTVEDENLTVVSYFYQTGLSQDPVAPKRPPGA
jgi:hypothetical protein